MDEATAILDADIDNFRLSAASNINLFCANCDQHISLNSSLAQLADALETARDHVCD